MRAWRCASYLATEIAIDHADGQLSRRDALHRLGLLGLSTVAASSLLASCSSEAPLGGTQQRRPGRARPPPRAPTAAPDYDVAAALARART